MSQALQTCLALGTVSKCDTEADIQVKTNADITITPDCHTGNPTDGASGCTTGVCFAITYTPGGTLDTSIHTGCTDNNTNKIVVAGTCDGDGVCT